MSEDTTAETRGLYRRHLTWWFRFYPAPGAAQVRVNLRTKDLAEALQKAADIRATAAVEVREIMQGCEAEVEMYLAFLKRDHLSPATISSRGYVLRPFIKEIAAPTPRAITKGMLQRWFDARWKEYPPTASAYLKIITWWFDWMKDRGKIPINPAKSVDVPQNLPMVRRRRFLKPKEARKVIDDCTEDSLKFCLYCALHAGFRKQEVIEARPSWFDLDAGLIHIEETDTFTPKTREKRTIPLTAELRQWLNHYGLRSPFMLAPGVIHGKYRYRYDFRAAFDLHMERCGFTDVTFHDLRRTFASILVSEGVSIYKVAKWLGDTVEQTENTYGHLIPQDDDINPSWATAKKKPTKLRRPPHTSRRNTSRRSSRIAARASHKRPK